MSNNKLGINIYAVLKADESDINNQIKKISDLVNSSGQKIVLPIQFDDSKIRELNTLLANIQNNISQNSQTDIINTNNLNQAQQELTDLTQKLRQAKGELQGFGTKELFLDVNNKSLEELRKNLFDIFGSNSETKVNDTIKRLTELNVSIQSISASFSQAERDGEALLKTLNVSGYDKNGNIISYVENFNKDGAFQRATTTVKESFADITKAQERMAKETQTVEKALEKFTKLQGNFDVLKKKYSEINAFNIGDQLKTIENQFINAFSNDAPIHEQTLLLTRLDTAIKSITVDIGKYELASNESSKQVLANTSKQQEQAANFERQLRTIKTEIQDVNSNKHVEWSERLRNQFDVAIEAVRTFGEANRAEMTDAKIKAQDAIQEFKNLVKQAQNAAKAATELRSKDVSSVVNDYANKLDLFKSKVSAAGGNVFAALKKDIDDLDVAFTKLKSNPVNSVLTEFLNTFDRAKSKFKETEFASNAFNKISQEALRLSNSLNSLAGQDVFRKYATNPDVEKFRKRIAEIVSDLDKLKQNITGATNAPAGERSKYLVQYTEELERLSQEYAKATSEAITFKSTLRNDKEIVKNRKDIQQLTAQITEYMNANTKAAKKYKGEFQSILDGLKMPNIAENAQQIKALSTEFDALRTRINMAGDAGVTLGQRLATAIRGIPIIGMYMSINTLAMRAVRNVREMINTVVELDTSMTALKRVTNETAKGYDDFLKAASKQAIELHTTISDLVDQTTTWVKLGNDLTTSSALAKISMMYSKVGDVDNDTAVKNLVSTMKAFNIEGEQSIRIVDMLDKLNNEFAVTAADLGEALSISGSALGAAGNSLEKTLALLTGGSEITQNSREFANALRTTSMRIRSMKGELQDLGEEYENVQSLSKIQTQILNYTGVNIFDDAENFRDTYDILKDISKVYFDLADTAKADLTEILFGKLRANQGIALLQAFQSGQVEKAYEATLKSAGTATTEFEKWEESLEAHIGSYKAAVQGLATTVIDDRGIRDIVDFGTSGLIILDKIVDRFGTMQTLLPIITASLSGFKNIGVFRTITDDMTGATNQLALFGKTFKQISADLKQGYGVKAFFNKPVITQTETDLLRDYSVYLRKGIVNADDFSRVLKGASSTAQIMGRNIIELNTQLKAGTITEQQYTAAVNQMTVAEQGATIASQALGTALKIALNVGIMIAINLIITGITSLINAEKEAREEAKQLAQETQEEVNALTELYTAYSEAKKALESGAGTKDEYKDATDRLIEKLGLERSEIHNLIQEYGDLDKALKSQTLSQILEDIPKIKSGTEKERKELSDVYQEYNAATITFTKKQSEIIDDWLSKSKDTSLHLSGGSLFGDYYYSGRTNTRFKGQQKEIEGIEKELEALKELQRYMTTNKELMNSNGYEQVTNRINTLNKAYEEYKEALKSTNAQTAKAVILQTELANEAPKTYEEFKKFRKSAFAYAQSDSFVNLFEGTIDDIEIALSNQLSSNRLLVAFENRYQDISELTKKYIGESISSGYEAQVKSIIESLSDEDLEIATKIPNLFEKGLNGVADVIADFKSNKNNVIEPEDVININEIIDSTNKKVKLIIQAMEEMSEAGKISSGTYKELAELGGNFSEALEIQNGFITLNVEKLKDLEKQELLNTITTNRLTIAELGLELARRAQAHGDFASIQAMIKELENENAIRQTLLDEITNAAPKEKTTSAKAETAEKSEDIARKNFEAAMKDIEHLRSMGLAADEDYYNALEENNEKYYKNVADHESDYLSNIEKIYNGRQKLYKEAADKELAELDKKLKLGYIKQEQYDKSLVELAEKYYGKGTTYAGTSFATENYQSLFDKSTENDQAQYKEQFEKTLNELDKQLEKGIITVQEYRAEYGKLRETWWGLGSQWSGTTFAEEMYESMSESLSNLDKLYEERLTILQKSNDKTLQSEADFVESWKALNARLYEGKDINKYTENVKKITDYQLSLLKRQYDEGLLSAKEYYAQMKQLLADSDILGKDYIAEHLNSAWDMRVQEEQKYWQQQKELMESYYDKQITALEKVNDEEEKLTKQRELQLNLIKAEQKLQEAKKNRNQLMFVNGGFEYFADQDAILSAQEDVDKAKRAITENQLTEQVELLKQQKEQSGEFYDTLLKEIEFYINKTLLLTESDREVLSEIRNSPNAKYARDLSDNAIAPDEIAGLIPYADESNEPEIISTSADLPLPEFLESSEFSSNAIEAMKVLASADFVNLVKSFGGNPTQQSVANFISGANDTAFNIAKQTGDLFDNSPTAQKAAAELINRAVNVGEVIVNLSMSVENIDNLVDDKLKTFCDTLGKAVKTEIIRVVANA